MNYHAFFRPILHILGILMTLLAVLMLVPAAVELSMAGSTPVEFLIPAAAIGFFGVMAALATRDDDGVNLNLKQAFLLTTLCWIVLPGFAALPLLGTGLETGLSYTDAVFEVVSGLTTTGSTVMSGLDGLLPGLLLWRSLLQWVGGIGIIVMAIILLPFLRVGGMQLFRLESSDISEKFLPRSTDVIRKVVLAYLTLSVLCALGYMLTGMSPFDAINHAMTTLSTGGYSTHDASFGHFGAASQWVSILFMIAGASPFIAFVKFASGRPRALLDDPQIQTFLKVLGAIVLASALLLMIDQDIDFFSALTLAAFNITSVATTTGYASTDYTLWGTGAVTGFFLLTVMGGCAGSTSGGIKTYRFQVLWITMRAQMLKLSSPNRVVLLRYHNTRMPEGLPVAVLAFLAAFFASIAVVTLLLAMMGLDFLTAASATAQAISGVGPGLGDIVGPAGNFASLPDGAKWLLSFTMILGRLEIFTFLVLLDPHFWQR